MLMLIPMLKLIVEPELRAIPEAHGVGQLTLYEYMGSPYILKAKNVAEIVALRTVKGVKHSNNYNDKDIPRVLRYLRH